MADRVSGGRLSRLFRLGWVARHGVPIAWKRLRQVADAKEGDRGKIVEEALDEHAGVAEEIFRALGDLKGLALKAGQMLSYLDGALPEEYRPAWQRVLSRLQADAPALPWSAVEPILAADLGRPVADVFAEIEETPFAAASIGQVHRARLAGTKEAVAVKVQYPGVDRALASDLDNAKLMKKLLAPFIVLGAGRAASKQADGILAELRARFLEELDYRREARMQERFRALLAGDPDLRVPRVFAGASGPRVLTSELAVGRTLAEACESAPQQDRDRWGLALNRFMLASVYKHRLLNADPHPGNYVFADDGTIVLLDFGCVKEIPIWMRDAMASYFRAGVRAERTGSAADRAAFEQAVAAAFHLDANDRGFALYVDFVHFCLEPYLHDREFTFSPKYAGETIDRLLGGVKQLAFDGRTIPRFPDPPPVPADYALISRLQWGFYSVLARLHCRGNYHRLLGEVGLND